VAPLAPLLGAVAAARRAASVWTSPYERRAAATFTAVAAALVLLALEASPIGAVRTGLRGPASSTSSS
jgi:hypothetical protein